MRIPSPTEFDLLINELDRERRSREVRERLAEQQETFTKSMATISSMQRPLLAQATARRAEAETQAAERQRQEAAKELARQVLPQVLAKALDYQRAGLASALDVARLQATVARFAESHGL